MDKKRFHNSKSELLYIWPDNLGIRKYLIGIRFYSAILSRLSVDMPFESQEKWGQLGIVRPRGIMTNGKGDVNYLEGWMISCVLNHFLLEGKNYLCKL